MVHGSGKRQSQRREFLFGCMRTPVDLNWLDRFTSNSGFGHRRRHTGFLILVVAVILAVGTTGILVAAGQSDPADGPQSKTIVFIPKSTDVTYWLFLRKGAADKANELGYTVQYQGVSRITAGSQTGRERNDGFLAAMKEYPGTPGTF